MQFFFVSAKRHLAGWCNCSIQSTKLAVSAEEIVFIQWNLISVSFWIQLEVIRTSFIDDPTGLLKRMYEILCAAVADLVDNIVSGQDFRTLLGADSNVKEWHSFYRLMKQHFALFDCDIDGADGLVGLKTVMQTVPLVLLSEVHRATRIIQRRHSSRHLQKNCCRHDQFRLLREMCCFCATPSKFPKRQRSIHASRARLLRGYDAFLREVLSRAGLSSREDNPLSVCACYSSVDALCIATGSKNLEAVSNRHAASAIR